MLLEWKMQVLLPAAAIVSVLVMLIQVPGFGILIGATAREWLWHHQNSMQALPLLCCWPMLYFIAIAFGRYRRPKAAMTQ